MKIHVRIQHGASKVIGNCPHATLVLHEHGKAVHEHGKAHSVEPSHFYEIPRGPRVLTRHHGVFVLRLRGKYEPPFKVSTPLWIFRMIPAHVLMAKANKLPVEEVKLVEEGGGGEEELSV